MGGFNTSVAPPSPAALDLKPPVFSNLDLAATLSHVEQLKGMEMENQQRALDLQDTKTMRTMLPQMLGDPSYKGADGTPDWDKITTGLAGHVSPKAAFSLQQMMLGNQQKRATILKTHADVQKINGELEKQEQDYFGDQAVKIAQNGYSAPMFELMLHDAESMNNPAYTKHVQDIRAQLAQNPDALKMITDGMISKSGAASTQQREQNVANANIAETQAKTTAQARQNAIQELSALTDQDGNITNPQAYQAWQQKYKDIAPPGSDPQSLQRFARSGVPAKDLPEYDIKTREAGQLAQMTPVQWDQAVDITVPDKNSALNKRTHAQVNFAISRGDFKAAQAAIKDAGDQLGRTETAVATAKQTAPIKIEVAAQTAQTKADQAGLTDDDYSRLGEQYARTGVMPSMGRDSITRGKIAHAASQWARDNGLSAAEVTAMQAAYAGDKESLKNFQKQRDQIVSFEQTAQKNLDLFLNAASKIPDTGVPWLNTPLRKLDANMVGSENMAAVNAARQIANNEIAKVTSGGGLSGVLSDSARHEVQDYNPQNATFKQTLAVAKMLKQDMANRHQSMDATLSDIKQRIGGGGTSNTAALPQGGGKKIDQATAQKFYEAAGRDPAKARQLATQNGWKVQ